MTEHLLKESEILNIEDAQISTLDALSGRLVKLEKLIEKQDNRNRDVIIGVLVASVLIVVTIAVQVSLSDRSDRQRSDDFLEKVYKLEADQTKIKVDFEKFTGIPQTINLR